MQPYKRLSCMTSAEWAADTGSYKNTWTLCRRELSPLGRRNIQRGMCVVLWMREEREVKKQAKPEKVCVFVCVCVLSGLFFCCEPPHCYATHRARDSPWTGQQSVLEKTLSLSLSLSLSLPPLSHTYTPVHTPGSQGCLFSEHTYKMQTHTVHTLIHTFKVIVHLTMKRYLHIVPNLTSPLVA